MRSKTRRDPATLPARARRDAALMPEIARVFEIDDDIGGTIRASPAWRAADDLLQSVPGVGPVASRTRHIIFAPGGSASPASVSLAHGPARKWSFAAPGAG